jgi:TRAP transporter TAXI family solute receptor
VKVKKGMRLLAVSCVILGLLGGSALAATTFINIGTGSTGGTYYPVGAAMCKIWNTAIPGLKASAQSTGGTVHNLQLMANKEAEAGFLDGLYYFAYQGKGKYEGNPQSNLRALVPLYAEPVHIMVAKGSGIKTLRDFKGKRVSVGAVASGTEVTAKELLKIAGLNPDKDIKPENLGLSDTAQAFSNKQIDAAITVGAVGIAGVVEAATMGVVEFIDLPDGQIKQANGRMPYYIPFTIPANTYKGQPNPIKTIASWNIVGVRDDLDPDLAYKMTKALFQNKKDLTNVSTRVESMSPENVKYILIPLHIGAKKYYKEIGAVTM